MNPVDEILPIIATAVAEWKADVSEQKIKEQVKYALDKQAKNVTLKLLGFEADNWKADTWSVDHCNGRAGNSAIGDYLRQTSAQAIKEWFDEIAKPSLTAAEKASLMRSCKQEYKDHLKDALRRKAKHMADEDTNALITEISKSNQIANHLKVMQLINPTGSK